MSDFTLGQQVTVTDYLFRTSGINSVQAVEIANVWPEMPEQVTQAASKTLDSARAETRHYGAPGRYKVWLPISLGPYKNSEAWGWLSIDGRRHPVVTDLNLPLSGIITRQVQLQDGIPEWEEGGAYFCGLSSRIGYEVTYHLSRRPVRVLPSMIQEVTP